MLRNAFRRIVGLLAVAPFILAARLLAPIVGEERAVAAVGPKATALAKLTLRLSVPAIQPGDDFNRFAARMKGTLRLWKPFFDVEITEENTDILKLRIANCPFCEALAACGESRLNPYVCRGDWAFAAENADRWRFERRHEIGNGDRFCDHTYKRLPAAGQGG